MHELKKSTAISGVELQTFHPNMARFRSSFFEPKRPRLEYSSNKDSSLIICPDRCDRGLAVCQTPDPPKLEPLWANSKSQYWSESIYRYFLHLRGEVESRHNHGD